MSKKDSIKNLRKSLLIDNDLIQEDERKFSIALDVYKVQKVKSPIENFIKSFKLEKLKIKAKNNDERTLHTFLLLSEMENLLKDESHSEDYIRNIVEIFKGKNLKSYIVKLNFKPRFIKKIENENSFKLPKTHIIIHKKAKITRKHLFRKGYMIPSAFGQIKQLNTKKLLKAQKFQDQFSYLEMKNQVIQKTKKFLENKKKGVIGKKILKWVDHKEIKGMDYRIRYEDIKSGRQKAIYYKDPVEAQNLKDNSIIQRVVVSDPQKAQKINVFISIWKVKIAEYFYNHYLKNLIIAQQKGPEVIAEENVRVRGMTKVYLEKHYPNLYDSGYDPVNTLNFENNSHMKVKAKSNKKDEDEVNEMNFATTIVPVIVNDEDDLEDHKRKMDLKSPFEKLDKEVEKNQVLFIDFLDSFKLISRAKNFREDNPVKYKFIENLTKNSILVLNFNKIVIDNIFSNKNCHLDEDEINSLIFKVETSVKKGNMWAESVTFAEESTTEFIAFDIDSSFKVDINNLKKIGVKLTNKLKNEVLVDLTINVQDLLDTFYLENMFHQGFDFEYKGDQMQGLISFLLILIPRNLEISHFMLNRELINTNFERFGDLITNCETYADYQKNFFTKEYFRIKEKKKCYEFFYYYNNYLPRINERVRHQENLILNSLKNGNFEEFVLLLKNVFKDNYNAKSLLTKTNEDLINNIQKGNSDIYDLITKVENLLSPKSRLLLNNFIFEFKNKNFLNLTNNDLSFGFHALQITRITKETENYLKKYDFLQSDEKYMVYDLIYKIYLNFDNNSFLGKNYHIFFSKHYIPMIINFVLVNSAELRNEDILKMIANQIINQNNMANYSDTGALESLNKGIIFFKIIFKKVYPLVFSTYMNYMISLDNFLCKSLINSFADIFDAIMYNIFSDFKNLMYVIFIAQEENVGFLKKFKKIGISFYCLIDILFVIEALNNQKHNFDNLNPIYFLKEIENSLKRTEINLSAIFAGIFKTLDFLLDQDFLYYDFSFLMKIINNRNQIKIQSFKNFSINIKSLKLKKMQLKGIIQKELIKNDIFSLRLKSLYKNKDKKAELDTKLSEDENEEGFDPFSSVIEEDIFFEITEEFENDMNEDLDVFQKKKLPKYESCVVYLNNLEHKLIESCLTNIIGKSDFNNILEFDFNELDGFLENVFGCSDVLRVEIYNDLSNILDKKKISLLNIIISIIISYTEDTYEISEMLSYLAKSLTNIFFETKPEKHFDKINGYILNQVYKFLPIAYYPEFEKNKIENNKATLFCYINNAKINLETYSIDITQICIKHFCASTFLTKEPSIHLNKFFCKDLEGLFSEMIQKGELEPNFGRFEIFIDVYQQGESHTINVPFKISFVPETTVFCKVQNPIFFKYYFSKDNLQECNVIEDQFLESPFCYFDFYSSLRSGLIFIGQEFSFKMIFKKLEFLKIKVNFKIMEPEICSNLISWNYEVEKPQQLIKMKKKEFEIDLPYTYFFLNFEQFFHVLKIYIVEVLDPEDIFKFIQLNNSNFSLNTTKNKDIDPKKHFYDLKDYEKTLKKKTKFEVLIKYK